ncbi:MAG: elongation factor Ts [Patescibacteria group bacterium]|nr:elongation factor Ts [Patescibacteria group bacterium]
MKITTEQIKQLRDTTGVSVMQCKRALEEAGGDMDQAIILLRKKSSDIASKKEGRELNAGVVAAYVHAGGNVGSMVELACETDFVAKNEEFKRLAYDIAMHVAASNPEFLSTEDITEEDKEKVRAAFTKEVAESDKPADIKEKILQGKIDTYFKEKALLEQSFIKDPSVTIKNLEEQAVQKFGEKTKVVRFVRFVV